MGLRGPLSSKLNGHAASAKRLDRVPPPPKTLGAAGGAEWERAAGELGPTGRNVLTAAHLGLLEDLGRMADDAEAFRAEWKKGGLTVVGQGREFTHPMIVASGRRGPP